MLVPLTLLSARVPNSGALFQRRPLDVSLKGTLFKWGPEGRCAKAGLPNRSPNREACLILFVVFAHFLHLGVLGLSGVGLLFLPGQLTAAFSL